MVRVVHFELGVDDPARAGAFYQQVFGWNVTKWDGPFAYWMVKTGEAPASGIDGGIVPRSDLVKTTVITLDVTDIDLTLAQVVAHGGKTLAPKMPIGDMGYIAYFQDTEGNVVGLWQNA